MAYSELISISEGNRSFDLKAWIDTLYDEVSATYSLSFCLEENTVNAKTPMNLVLMCRVKGAYLPLSEAFLRLGDSESISRITESLKNLVQYSALVNRSTTTAPKGLSAAWAEDIYTFLSETELYSRFL